MYSHILNYHINIYPFFAIIHYAYILFYILVVMIWLIDTLP